MAVARTSIATGERAEARRRELLDAADRVIRRRGPDASMDEIAAAAGITKPILYRHFGNKSGLYAALAVRYMQRFFEVSESALAETHPRKRIAKAVDAYLQAVEREPEIFRFVRRATIEQQEARDAASAELDRHAAAVARPIRRNLEEIGLDPEPADAWAYGVVGMVQFVAGWWLETRSLPRERLVDQLTALLWEGFGHLHEAPARYG
jgi:AcrR family transcriptional regulator